MFVSVVFHGLGFWKSYDDRRRGTRNRRNVEEMMHVTKVSAVAAVVEFLDKLCDRFMDTLLFGVDDQSVCSIEKECQ